MNSTTVATAGAERRRIRVLIVDDSALVRSLLTDILRADPGIEVVGVASDAHVAREKIKQLNPDVLTLDVEMPRMDGITFLRNLMKLRPMPVVMISSLTERGADTTLAALDLAHGVVELGDEIVAKIKVAARARVGALAPRAQVSKPTGAAISLQTTERVVAIGASTGGTEALARILATLPPDGYGIVIAQHIVPEFSPRFAARL